MLVFQSNAKFALAPPGPKMLQSAVVVEATAVAVVSLKEELIPVTAPLASVDGQSMVYVRASYYCKVLDPVLVLESGCWRVGPRLHTHLLDDPKLRMLGMRDDMSLNPEVPQRILARTLARTQIEPLSIPGMQVKLADLTLGIQAASWGQPAELPEPDPDFDSYGPPYRDGYQRNGRDGYQSNGGNAQPRDGYASYPKDLPD